MSATSIDAFKTNHSDYVALAGRLKVLFEELLNQCVIKFHFVEARAKSVESFAEKLSRPGKKYSDPLNDMPDLVGARIVVYYSDDVSKCGKLIEKEFDVVEAEGSHQPDRLSVDQFGYLSMHYVARLAKNRRHLLEWKAYGAIKFEIQIRTVLQHSWAAVSHALQYKRDGDVPHDLRRKLHRLAGLFELADEQFLDLRDLAKKKAKEAAKAIARGKVDIPIDAASIRALIDEWGYLDRCMAILESLGINEGREDSDFQEFDRDDHVGDIVEHCDRLNIHTVAELKSELKYDPLPYFRNIAESAWGMDKEFVLYLLLIGARPSDFTVSLLTETSHWHTNIAKRVVEGANKTQMG